MRQVQAIEGRKAAGGRVRNAWLREESTAIRGPWIDLGVSLCVKTYVYMHQWCAGLVACGEQVDVVWGCIGLGGGCEPAVRVANVFCWGGTG